MFISILENFPIFISFYFQIFEYYLKEWQPKFGSHTLQNHSFRVWCDTMQAFCWIFCIQFGKRVPDEPRMSTSIAYAASDIIFCLWPVAQVMSIVS